MKIYIFSGNTLIKIKFYIDLKQLIIKMENFQWSRKVWFFLLFIFFQQLIRVILGRIKKIVDRSSIFLKRIANVPKQWWAKVEGAGEDVCESLNRIESKMIFYWLYKIFQFMVSDTIVKEIIIWFIFSEQQN